MEQLTTYRAKGKDIGLEFLFKYDLNGDLKAFEIQEGQLNNEQIGWLFSPNFPATEIIMKTVWMVKEKYIKVFQVEVSPADLSFDALWIIYDYKVAKQDAIKFFKRLNESEKIEVFIDVPKYKQWLKYNPKSTTASFSIVHQWKAISRRAANAQGQKLQPYINRFSN